MPQRKRASLLTQKRVAVVVNPYSAQRRWERNPKLRQYLHRKFPGRVFDQTGDKAEMIAQVKRLSQENDIIIALGGDGTLADVMQGIFEAGREKDILLGIIPFGSGNALRKSLLIPKALKKALKLLSRGEPHWIDLIDLGGKVASFLSIGATGKVTQNIEVGRSLVQRFKGLVEQHFSEWHQVQDYAKELNVSPGYLNEVISSAIQKPAKEYIQNRLILETKRLSLFTSKSNKEIGYELGFDDPSHFSKFFKTFTGNSIGEFREAHHL